MRTSTQTELLAAFDEDARLRLAPGDGDSIAPSWRRVAANDDERLPVPGSPDPFAIYIAARAHRSRVIGWWLRRGLRAALAALRRIVERERQRQRARALYETLSRLDDRTLQDIGFHRTEL